MPGEESSDAQFERLKQQLQQIILNDYPNPERNGCPGEVVLRELAGRYLDDSLEQDPNWQHVAHCSPCYREFLDFRAAMKRVGANRTRSAAVGITVMAVLLAAVAWYFTRSDSPRPERPQIAELIYRPRMVDLEGRSMTRSDEGNQEVTPIVLGRELEELTIRLPFGSRPGKYEVQLLTPDKQPLVSTGGDAQLVAGTTSVQARIDFSRFQPGKYLLGVRRRSFDWTYYPAEVR